MTCRDPSFDLDSSLDVTLALEDRAITYIPVADLFCKYTVTNLHTHTHWTILMPGIKWLFLFEHFTLARFAEVKIIHPGLLRPRHPYIVFFHSRRFFDGSCVFKPSKY